MIIEFCSIFLDFISEYEKKTYALYFYAFIKILAHKNSLKERNFSSTK